MSQLSQSQRAARRLPTDKAYVHIRRPVPSGDRSEGAVLAVATSFWDDSLMQGDGLGSP